MLRLCILLALLSFVSLVHSQCSGGITTAEVKGFLDVHNKLRQSISSGSYVAKGKKMPAAKTPIPNLTWDCEIEKSAQKVASTCVFAHSKNRNNLGENLYTYGSSAGMTIQSLSFLLVATIVHSAPVKFDDLKEHFSKDFYHKQVNITAAELVFEEEADRLGISSQEHFLACKVPTEYIVEMSMGKYEKIFRSEHDCHLFVYETRRLMDNFLPFNTTERLIELWRAEEPKSFGIASKLMDNFNERYGSKLDSAAQAFVTEVRETLLEAFIFLFDNDYYKKIPEKEKKKGAVKILSKSLVAFENLPQSSKNNIDKVLCFQTTLRLVNKDNEFARSIEILKKEALE